MTASTIDLTTNPLRATGPGGVSGMGVPEKIFLVAAGVTLMMPYPATAQAGAQIEPTRITQPVTIDGLSQEPAWAGVPTLPMVMYQPTFRGVMTERTEIRVAYDAEFLYVAGRFYDDAPDRIRINSLYRDRTSGDDVFGIVIDPFDDNENGLWFWTTPAGVRGDAAISGDLQGNTNTDWNTHWDAAAVVTDEGWFAEMRIPFSSVGFQSAAGRVRMAFSTYRFIGRKNERHVFPAISSDFQYLRPSLAHDASLSGVQTHRPVYLTPYLLSGVGRTTALNATRTGYDRNDDVPLEVGGDAKYNVTNDLTLDLTVNTDFAQAEADDQQVNLTRYSLFFPEKRQFFQERSSIFDFFTGGNDRLFHSRRVGLNVGEPVRILGGARLAGRIGAWEVGGLTMQTGRAGGLPAENFGVLRTRRRLFNEHSTAGGMLTTRVDERGAYNVAYGLDSRVRVAGDDYLTVRWAQTVDDSILDARGFRPVEAGLFRVSWQRVRQQGFTYFFSGRFSGADYNPGAGFVTRRDFSEYFYALSYYHLFGANNPLRRFDPFQLFGNVVLRNEDRTVESAFIEHDVDFQWKSGAGIGLDLEWYYDDLREPLSFPANTTVPAGQYRVFRFEGDARSPSGNLLRLGGNWGVQQFYDGWRANLRVGPQWNASRFLDLNLQYQIDVVRFPERDEGFDAHILRLRARAAANTHASLAAFVQYSNVADLAAANLRFRYNIREGNDVWVVYNHGVNLDRTRLDPRLPLTDNQTLLVKYTHTFTR